MSIKGNAESNILRGRVADPDKIHGLSAYELDVMYGKFDGTLDEWLKVVRGDFDERVEEAKAEFDNEVDTVIVPEAKVELESAKDSAVAEIADAETNSLKVLGNYTNSSIGDLKRAAAVADEKEVLLWENPNPSAEFTSGTISIDYNSIEGIDGIGDIDSLRVVFLTRTIGNVVLPSVQVKLGQSGNIHFAEGSNTAKAYSRTFLVHSTGNIQFEGADPNNAVCIPYRIYGVKNKEINITGLASKSYAHETFANSLKASASGTVVFLSDVSPVISGISCKVRSDSISDLTSVTVYRSGKNLLNTKQITPNSITQNGATLEVLDDGGIRGSGMAEGYISLGQWSINLPKSGKITLSASGDFTNMGCTLSVFDSLGNTVAIDGVTAMYKKRVFDLSVITDIAYGTFDIKRSSNNEVCSGTAYFQVEIGDSTTSYESPIPPISYTVSADGTVEGITSLYPSTLLMTDNVGAVVDCTYNRDLNKALEEITQAIISLGGNV